MHHHLLRSPLWNEPRNAGCHHCIQPLSGLNSVDFVKRIFRKGRDVKIFARAPQFLGGLSKAVPRCTAHASSTCAGILLTRAAIAEINGSSSSPGFIP